MQDWHYVSLICDDRFGSLVMLAVIPDRITINGLSKEELIEN